jgi:hypothetical protein
MFWPSITIRTIKVGSSALIVVVDRFHIDELSGLVAGTKGVILQQALTRDMMDHLFDGSSETKNDQGKG